MPVPDNALAPVRQLEIGMPGQEGRKLRLDRLLDQTFRPGPQNFSQRIVNFVWLTERENSILIHGVTLLREVRAGLDTNPRFDRPKRAHLSHAPPPPSAISYLWPVNIYTLSRSQLLHAAAYFLLSRAIARQPMSRRKNPSGHFIRSIAAYARSRASARRCQAPLSLGLAPHPRR